MSTPVVPVGAPVAIFRQSIDPTLVGGLATIAVRDNVLPPVPKEKGLWETSTVAAPDSTRWNRHYPYQLAVVRRYDEGGETRYRWEPGWQFTLPVPPESLTMAMPVATELRPTLGGGMLIEHGGAPFRNIVISGTTGVLGLRKSAIQNPVMAAIQAAQQLPILAGVISSVASTAEVALRGVPAPNFIDVTDTTVARSSGYYQFRLLQLFLERYVAIKETADGRDLRLALCVWKDESIYLIELQSFDLTRSSGGGAGPLSYSYRISARAWRRIEPPAAVDIIGLGIGAPFAGRIAPPLAMISESLRRARETIETGRSTLVAGVGRDATEVFDIAREAILLGSAAMTVADLPRGLEDAVYGAQMQFRADISPEAKQDAAALSKAKNGTETITDTGIRDQDAKPLASKKRLADPSTSYVENSRVPVDELQLSTRVRRAIAVETDRIRRLTRRDWERRRDRAQQVADVFADSIGMGSTVRDDALGRISVPARRVATDEDYLVLASLQDVVHGLDQIVVLKDSEAPTQLTPYDYVAGLASEAGIAFQTPVSKFAVPFPLGGSLEQLALTYLGSVDRWHEIATLNGLRSPWVDETGVYVPLLIRGRGNTVVVADATPLQIGDRVSIVSSRRAATTRRVVSTTSTAAGWEVVVDGDADLEDYDPLDAGKLHYFLPGTVNSTMQLFIPSDQAVPDELVSRDVPGLSSFQTLLDRGGVDLALTPTGDLVVTDDGDTPWSVGLKNIIQRLRLLFATPRGSLLRHPEFGLAVPVGTSTADLNAQELLKATQAALSQDPDFASVEFVRVSKSGPGLRQEVHVSVAGVQQLIPVGIDVRP